MIIHCIEKDDIYSLNKSITEGKLILLADEFINKTTDEILHRYRFAKIDFIIKCSIKKQFIGFICLHERNLLQRNTKVTLELIDREISASCVFEILDYIFEYLFDYLNLRKVYLPVLTKDNKINLIYKSYGFKLEGVLREHCFYRNEFLDISLYSFLQKNYIRKMYAGK